jgi:hypothetical protein
MVGWKVPAPKPRARSRPRTQGQLFAEREQERKEVIRHTGGKEGFDEMNLRNARYFLEHIAEYGEGSIQAVYARNVFERLGQPARKDAA